MATKLLYFGGEFCTPCSEQKPIISEIEDETDVTVETYDIEDDDGMDVANEYNVRSVPTMIVLEDGKPQEQFMGLTQKNELLEAL